MASKLLVLLALAAAAHGSAVGSLDHAAVVEPVREDVTSFSYDIADPYTGDFKSQSETRVGGTVQGQYSLLDADGTRRTVDYAADDFNGFNAVVRKDAVGVAAPVVAAKVVTPTVARTVSAPLVTAPHVVTGGTVLADRAYTAPTVYAASAPLVSRTVFNGGLVGAHTGFTRNVAPTVFTGASRLVDTHTLTAPAVVNTGVLSRAYAAPATVVSGGARFFDSRTFTAPAAFNTGVLSRAVATPVLSSRYVTDSFASPRVYAASAPLVTGSYTDGHGLFATRTHDGRFYGFGGRLVSPFSGHLVTGHDVVRTDW